MAVDYGDVRTGIAFGVPINAIAGETLTITERNTDKLVAVIADLAAARNVPVIALGYPYNADGTIGFRAEKTQKLADKLTDLGMTVALVDERYTTLAARELLRSGGKKTKKNNNSLINEVAAAIILEEYFNAISKQRQYIQANDNQ